MRTQKTTTFRPFLETVEPRILATAGVTPVVHQAAHVSAHPSHPVVSIESHHATQPVKHQVAAAPKHHAQPTHTGHANPSSSTTTTTITKTKIVKTTTISSSPTPPLPINTTTNEAWVDLANMTGHDLEFQIKLGPYADGEFLPMDIAAGSTQYLWSSLISNGQRVEPDFAIEFDNGPVTPLVTGISQQTAQGYYIFQGTDAQYFVVPFLTWSGLA
jgi:hypothetical protein